MDFIFGTLATDALKHVYHRAFRLGIQHRHAIHPANPRPNEPVTLTAWVGTDCDVDALACYYMPDDHTPSGAYGVSENSQVARFHEVSTEWDTLAWGYLTRWEVTLPAQSDGTIVQYRIGGWRENDPDPVEIFADSPVVDEISEAAGYAFSSGQTWAMPHKYPTQGKTFAYRVDSRGASAWAYDAVIYQLLVDRFYPGDGQAWTQTDNTGLPMGGTLWGVRDRLGYLIDLGINTIWLSPTWISPSAHGYDAVDFRHTADHLGGDTALHALIEAAHARGLRVLLDLPCNHVSNQHPLFLDACSSPASPYRDWFIWNVPPHDYKTFFGVATMPKLNLNHPAARDWMCETARYWLREFDIDGYRLDYANGPGPTFGRTSGQPAKTRKPIVSHIRGGNHLRAGTSADIFRALRWLSRFLCEPMFAEYFRWKSQSEHDYASAIRKNQAFFPRDFGMPAFIDNHDMNRFLHIANGDKQALRAAVAALMALPNPPILYYGTEIGLNHTISTRDAGLEVGRVAMLWGDRQDRALLDDISTLIHTRRAAKSG